MRERKEVDGQEVLWGLGMGMGAGTGMAVGELPTFYFGD